MTDPHPMDANVERMQELLADLVIEGLSAPESAQLANLLRGRSDADAAAALHEFERAAAQTHLALLQVAVAPGQPSIPVSMPASIQNRLEAAAADWALHAPLRLMPTTRESSRDGSRNAPGTNAPPAALRFTGIARLGWLAAAACLALAAIAWWPGLSTRVFGPAAAPDLRARLLRAAPPDLIQWNWTATSDPAAQGARGDVVWSNARQEGYMRFRGLAVNDPAVTQYQLWIFDRKRPDATPVDGGVFDIDLATGDVIVPIRATIPVFDPAMFAVTIEKPGGVVVSERGRIPVLAKPAEQDKT